MDDTAPKLQQLRSELETVENEFWSEWQQLMTWQLQVGPIRIQRSVGSQTITRVYLGINSLLLALGFGLVFVGGSTSTAGVAFMVGALFGFGAFVSQFWVVTKQREFDVTDQVLGRAQFTKLKELERRREAILRRLRDLDQM